MKAETIEREPMSPDAARRFRALVMELDVAEASAANLAQKLAGIAAQLREAMHGLVLGGEDRGDRDRPGLPERKDDDA